MKQSRIIIYSSVFLVAIAIISVLANTVLKTQNIDPTARGEQVKSLVDLAITTYDKQGLEGITNNLMSTNDQNYILIADLKTKQILAHTDPAFVGKNIEDVYSVNGSWDDYFLSEKTSDGSSMWTHLSPLNSANVEPITLFLKSHNGLVFGAEITES